MATDRELKARLSWKAKSVAISAMDIAEGVGIDTDGDGDLSGYDGSRPTLEEAISQASQEAEEEAHPWLIVGKDPSPAREPEFGSQEFHFTYGDNRAMRASTGIKTPKSVSAAVTLSIAGHAFWNGSSFLSYYLPDAYSMGGSATVIIQFTWTAFPSLLGTSDRSGPDQGGQLPRVGGPPCNSPSLTSLLRIVHDR